MSDLPELYEGCRSYRRFQQKEIPVTVLEKIAETARKRSSARNEQLIRYVVVSRQDLVREIQPCLHWAARLPKEIGTPKKDEEPTAFVIVLVPEKTDSLVNIDAGIVLDTMAITAWSYGVGSCILGAVERKKLAAFIPVPEGYAISVVLALGYPAHTSTIVEPDDEHGLAYYVDEERNYYVPKRPTADVIQWIS